MACTQTAGGGHRATGASCTCPRDSGLRAARPAAPGPADTQPRVRPLPFPTARPGPFFSRPSQIPSCLPFIFCCIGPSLLLESPVPTGQSPRSAEQGCHIPAASPSALSAGYFFLAGWELENDSCIFLLDWSPYFTYLPKSSPSPAGIDVHVTRPMTATVMATTSWLSCLTEETREAGAVACSGRHPVPRAPAAGDGGGAGHAPPRPSETALAPAAGVTPALSRGAREGPPLPPAPAPSCAPGYLTTRPRALSRGSA